MRPSFGDSLETPLDDGGSRLRPLEGYFET